MPNRPLPSLLATIYNNGIRSTIFFLLYTSRLIKPLNKPRRRKRKSWRRSACGPWYIKHVISLARQFLFKPIVKLSTNKIVK